MRSNKVLKYNKSDTFLLAVCHELIVEEICKNLATSCILCSENFTVIDALV